MDSTCRMNYSNTREDAGKTQNCCRCLGDFLVDTSRHEEKQIYRRYIWKLNIRCDRLALRRGQVEKEIKEDF